MRVLGFFILVLPLLFGLVLTLFPVHALYGLYRLLELVCKPFGNECRESLKNRYENLGENPWAYGQDHPIYIVYCRVIGVLILIFYTWLFTHL